MDLRFSAEPFRRHHAAALCLFITCLWPGRVLGQQYPFLPVPGGPKSVESLFQDSRGRLWLGGPELACFDGTRFFFLRDYGLPPVHTYAISEDSSGAIWLGMDTGVYRFANGRAEQAAVASAISVIPVSPSMVVAAAGPAGQGIPVNTNLIRIQRIGNVWKTETIMNLDSPGLLTLDSSGKLLYPWPNQGWNEIRLEDVVRWHAGAQVPVVHHAIAHAPGNGTMKVMRDHEGCLWRGAPHGVAYDCGDGGHNAPTEDAEMTAAMHEGPDGTMVLTGNSMLAVGRPGAFQVATRANGLPGLLDAIKARDGTIWLGTTTGLYRFASPFRIESWTIREGLPDPPWSVTRMGDKIYAGLDRRIVVLSKDRLRWDSLARFDKGGIVTNLLPAGDGALLASFISGGAVEVAPDGRVVARTAPNHPNCCSMRLARTAGGETWLSGNSLARLTRIGHLLKLDEHPLEMQPAGNGLAVRYEEHTRRLWACYNGGLVVRDGNGAWREITTRDGLAVNGCWSLAPLPNGDVWYTYYQMPAIARIRLNANGHVDIRQYNARDGIPEPGGDTLDADRRGWLWRGGEVGFYVADPAEADAGQWLMFNLTDGFPANGMNSGSVFVDTDGSLWWGADNDLAHFLPPPDLVNPAFAPAVFLSAFSWDGGPPRLAEAVASLPHGSKVVAHIGSLQFDRRNGMRLRYRVLPGDRSWRETAGLDLPLGALPSGAHTLEIEARVFTGPWSKTVSRSFTVLRPDWLSWPLTVSYFMTLTLLTAGGFLLHRRRRADDAQLLPDLAAWRLGALLPDAHFLKGTLLDGRFEVGDLLARGGFAYVMYGYDRIEEERCAIKIFRSEVKEQDWVQRRFGQEVAALAKMRHPNVVPIRAHGHVPSGAPYLVMDYIEGRSLREALDGGPLPPDRAGTLLRQLADALDAIHAQGICHRDVKPENIIVRDEGTPREQAVLIDFSIAIVKDATETLYGLSRAAGTFDYMGPEQAIGYAQPSSDIYSLAKIVIEMLTGRQLKHLLPDAALDLPDRVRDLLRTLDLPLSAGSIGMLAAALEFDPSRRPGAAGDFAAPLVRDLAGAG
jgi:tRNA A-37 threonylcarbamoyl transferase component Bud32